METKFTKGPWSINPEIRYSINNVAGKHIAIVNCSVKVGEENAAEENLANAKLIEVAPEMYEILTDIYEYNYSDYMVLIVIKNLLNKINR